jgi:hypothetical protein
MHGEVKLDTDVVVGGICATWCALQIKMPPQVRIDNQSNAKNVLASCFPFEFLWMLLFSRHLVALAIIASISMKASERERANWQRNSDVKPSLSRMD